MIQKLVNKIDWQWRLAKLGNALIRIWIQSQYDIDGDFVQTDEIQDEWRANVKKEIVR
jgi:hypothetical protein